MIGEAKSPPAAGPQRLLGPRLALRMPAAGDAPFIVSLLNDPDWIRYIGDRGVRNTADALRYLDERLLSGFRQYGFGLWAVEPRDGGHPVGLCGLLRRPTHPDVEMGFAFLPEGRGRGMAAEAAQCVLDHAERALRLSRLIALTLPDNGPSLKLLTRLGFGFEDAGIFDGGNELVHRYAIALPRP